MPVNPAAEHGVFPLPTAISIFDVRRKDREALFNIRAGVYSYSELIEKADEKLKRIEELYQKSDLPAEPDCDYAEKLLISMRGGFYSKRKDSNHRFR